MPRKKKSLALRYTFGDLERLHLIDGDCAMGHGCSICTVIDDRKHPCPRPLKLDLAEVAWRKHRAEILAEWNLPRSYDYYARKADDLWYGWGWLTPRLPTFAEIWFEDVPFPNWSDAWPEPAQRQWTLLGIRIARLNAACANNEEDYLHHMETARIFRRGSLVEKEQ
jgi:hypothetical protein